MRDITIIESEITALVAEQTAMNVERKARIRAAEDAINAEYRDRNNSYSVQVGALQREQVEAEQAAIVNHKWEGRKVKLVEMKAARWSNRRHETTTYGLVETRRRGTEMPGNRGRWSLPKMGQAFVRLLKKDGTPGLQFTTLTAEWTLADEEVPSEA